MLHALVFALALISAALAWESCTDLSFASFDGRACLALSLDGSRVTASGGLGTRQLGPYQWDLATLAEGPTFEACIPVFPAGEACLRVEDCAVRVAAPRRLDGCFFVAGRLLKRVVVTRALGCVNLTHGGKEEF